MKFSTLLWCASRKHGPKCTELFQALRTSLTSGVEAEEYAAIGARLGMNEGAVKKAAFDLRAKFARTIREQIRQTVRDETLVDEELRYLIKLLRP